MNIDERYLMRVAHIITRLILGGAQENTLYSVDDQHHLHGDQVCLITGPGLGPEGTLIPRAMARELDVRVLQDLHRSLSPVKDMRALRAIIRQLKEFAPDVVHTHSSKAGILGRYAAHRLGIPAVHTIHGASFHYGQPAVLHWCYRQAERMAARWCQRFISVCDAMSNQYVQAGIASADKFTTIYSGMETQNFLNSTRDPSEFRRELGLHPEHVVVTKVARLFHLKGHEYLLDAAPAIVNAVPNVRFVLVGDGVLRDEFQQRIRGMGLDQHFIFTGLISPEDVGSYIHASDMVVHTSVWEGLARVLPQGSLAGKPIISFDNDGAPEVCIHEQTGLLVPVRNTKKLEEAVIRLASDPALRIRLGQNGRTHCSTRFCHRHMTEQIRLVYEEVLRSAVR